MKTITLNNGVEMPMLGFGTFLMPDSAECENSVRTAIQAGYRLIDTAQDYGNEASVGRALRRSGVPREEVFITTKVWFRSFQRGICRESVLESMRKLEVSYLDMVLLHWPFNDTYGAWKDLEALYKEGTIRAIGVSNFDPDRLIDFIHFHEIPPAVNQIETHLLCQRKEDHRWMRKYGVVHQAYAPLGQGRAPELMSDPAVAAAARAHGKTPPQVLLRFLIQCGIAVVPKSTHEERILENAQIFDFQLTDAEMDELRRADRKMPLSGRSQDPYKVEAAMTW